MDRSEDGWRVADGGATSGFGIYTRTYEGDRESPATSRHPPPGRKEQDQGARTAFPDFSASRAPAREGLTLGIDLGAAGAVSLLDREGHLLDVRDVPCLDDGPRARPTVSASGFAAIVREWQPERAVVEFVSSRPTDSPASAFAFGMARATVMATLEVLGVSAEFITVPVWKRTVGIGAGKGQKSTARAEATRRWPQFAEAFARARDDGRSESALIGFAGIMRARAGR